jgi:hypothetical protein
VRLSGLGGCTRDMGIEQLATAREMAAASTIGEEAIVADAMETVREGVQQKAADELIDCERHWSFRLLGSPSR